MSDEVEQRTPQQTGPHRFRSGKSGNPQGGRGWRFNIQRKMNAFAAPYGGLATLGADEVELIRQAALLATCRVGDAEQRVRTANALRGIFELLADRRRDKNLNELRRSEDALLTGDELIQRAMQQLEE